MFFLDTIFTPPAEVATLKTISVKGLEYCSFKCSCCDKALETNEFIRFLDLHGANAYGPIRIWDVLVAAQGA